MAIGPLSAPAGSVGRVGSNDHQLDLLIQSLNMRLPDPTALFRQPGLLHAAQRQRSLSPQSVDQVDSGPSILTNKFPHPPVSLFFFIITPSACGFWCTDPDPEFRS